MGKILGTEGSLVSMTHWIYIFSSDITNRQVLQLLAVLPCAEHVGLNIWRGFYPATWK